MDPMATNSTLCWRDVINKHKTLVIPYYQRGYIWGKASDKRTTDAVTFMLDTLENPNGENIFIQGVTVWENDDDEIFLIDGQQRTTFFYLLLRLKDIRTLKLKYIGSRGSDKDSEEGMTPAKWIDNFDSNTPCDEDPDEYYQDIYYFKKTVRLIKERLKRIDLNLVLEHVRFLWINISEEQQLATFQMMNGNKAEMKAHELLKADMLRCAASGDGGYVDAVAQEWDNNMLRRTYAQSWDRWLYWWNQPEVKDMYRLRNENDNELGRLLQFTFSDDSKEKDIFEKWKPRVAEERLAMHAKRIFQTLRCNQIKMEEAFADKKTYNRIGVILCLVRSDEQDKFLARYFKDRPAILEDLELVINLLLFGATLQEILNGDHTKDGKTKLKIYDTAKFIQERPLYSDKSQGRELAYRYLLVRNVEKDTGRNHKFDFSIWNGNRSLEHVVPKSRVFHQNPDGQWLDHEEKNCDDPINVEKLMLLTREDIQARQADLCKENIYASWELSLRSATVNEHSIGNLLLLYGSNNSQFGNKLPILKRRDYFDITSQVFRSRNLLHTMFSFCRFEKDFGVNEILENQIEVIIDINNRLHTIYSEDEKA